MGSKADRLTQERASVLQISCELGSHFTAEQIQQALAARGWDMATTTIYRNLPAIESAGIIRRTTFREENENGAATYEHIWGRVHHDHLLCRGCGKRVEFQYEALEVLQREVARQHGFTLLSHHLDLEGLCRECSTHIEAEGRAQ